MKEIGLKNIELLRVRDEGGALTVGGSQYWYPKEGYIPQGACGATTASNVLAYLLRSRPELFAMAEKAGLDGLAGPVSVVEKAGYLEFMKKVYKFMYPRVGGLMSGGYLEGMAELAAAYGLPIEAERLHVPVSSMMRPKIEEAAAFIRVSLEDDLPVAFLVLTRGSEHSLDIWHWVTVTSFDDEAMVAAIADNGKEYRADVRKWLDTSIMGGAFVRMRVPG